jgi:proteasome accessory factor A
MGLETEYAIRFTPADGTERPRNDWIFEAIKEAIQDEVATRPGTGKIGEFFTENGGVLSYEMLPHLPDGGLIEGGTPECTSPLQVLTYQKALDRMLVQALPAATETLTAQGFSGEIALLKNCRDAFGNVYGAQENYSTEAAQGLTLLAYRACLLVFIPTAALMSLLFWLLAIGMVLSDALGAAFAVGKDRRKDPTSPRLSHYFWEDDWEALPWERRIGAKLIRLHSWALDPFLRPFAWMLQAFVFRRQRRAMTAFLVSRPILCGAGSLLDDGSFVLSEKGPAIKRLVRSSVDHDNRPIFDPANFFKNLMGFAEARPKEVLRLFPRTQRMQLGLSDSNLAQAAEYLKVGTTWLVVQMAEAGFLKDAPRLRNPIGALHALIRDPTLKAKALLKNGAEKDAIALQRYYLGRAKEWSAQNEVTGMQTAHIIKVWEWALENLATDPTPLIGHLDWVTKRFVLDRAGEGLDQAARKKIDLSYHELGTGLFAQLESMGLTAAVVEDAQVNMAIHTAPPDSPAHYRGKLIAELARDNVDAKVTWDQIRIGGPISGKVINLSDYR